MVTMVGVVEAGKGTRIFHLSDVSFAELSLVLHG